MLELSQVLGILPFNLVIIHVLGPLLFCEELCENFDLEEIICIEEDELWGE
jgi:hypothetical protein